MISLFASFWNIAEHIISVITSSRCELCSVQHVSAQTEAGRAWPVSVHHVSYQPVTLSLRVSAYLQLSLLTADNLLFLHCSSETLLIDARMFSLCGRNWSTNTNISTSWTTVTWVRGVCTQAPPPCVLSRWSWPADPTCHWGICFLTCSSS